MGESKAAKPVADEDQATAHETAKQESGIWCHFMLLMAAAQSAIAANNIVCSIAGLSCFA